MNYRKAMLGLSIALGAIIGGYLGAVDTEFLLGGAIAGGLLGGLIYYVIYWAVSRRINEVLPYDGLDGHKQANSHEHTQIQNDTPFRPRY